VRAKSAAAGVATSARGNTLRGNADDDASGIDAAQARFASIAGAIAKGYSFGPRTSCAFCNATLVDFDSKCCGFCERCHAAIQACNVAAY